MKMKKQQLKRKGRIWQLLKNQRGFTMVELLAVLIILGILAAIAVPRVSATIQNSRERACAANLIMVNSAIERFGVDHLNLTTSQADFSGLSWTALIPDYLEIRGNTGVNGAPVCPATGTEYTLPTVVSGTPVVSCAGHGSE